MRQAGFIIGSKTKLVILGAQGQVGRAVAAQAGRRRIAGGALGRAECDITDRAAVARAVAGSGLVVNCAAYTSVDQAEAEVETAYRINAVGAETVATVCAEAGIPLLHLSTDYVFDGASPLPAREDDPARPVNAHGRSKLAGEIAVRERLQSHIVLRTSWVFSADGQNFVKTMLRLAHARAPLQVVDDQIGGPVSPIGAPIISAGRRRSAATSLPMPCLQAVTPRCSRLRPWIIRHRRGVH